MVYKIYHFLVNRLNIEIDKFLLSPTVVLNYKIESLDQKMIFYLIL